MTNLDKADRYELLQVIKGLNEIVDALQMAINAQRGLMEIQCRECCKRNQKDHLQYFGD